MRKFLILLLCTVFILPIFLFSTPAQAADSYLITVTEESVQENVNNNGMAVYIDGIIYAPYTTFKSLHDITVNYSTEKQFVSVYRSGVMIFFELDTGKTYEHFSKQSIKVSAKMRDGVPYLPVAVVSAWMNLSFSITPAADIGLNYPVIRLCSKEPSTPDSVLYRLVSSKLASVAKARDRKSGIAPVVEPLPERDLAIMITIPPQDTPSEAPVDEENEFTLSSLLHELLNYNLPASFFFAENDIVPHAEDLREIYCNGIYPGILITDGESPIEQAQRCSEIYAQVLHIRVRLVTASDGLMLTDQQKAGLQDAGYLLWEADHRPDTDVSSNKLLSSIKTSLKKADSASVLTLAPQKNTLEIIPMLFSYLEDQKFTVLPMTELTSPY